MDIRSGPGVPARSSAATLGRAVIAPFRAAPRLVLAGLLALGACTPDPEATEALVQVAPPRPSASGRLHVSLHGGSQGDRSTHSHRFVKGAGYASMDDNDLRGFLDGRFQYGWNQPSQVHVRLGRRHSSPRYGETELFRVVQRWDGLLLPRDAEIERVVLRVSVERGVDRPLPVMLYALNRDFAPGRGGAERNNNGAPEPGDVWWGERARGKAQWGLPGAGFASSLHPGADTPAVALAEAHYEPDASFLEFSSEGLRAFVAERVASGRPLGFLLKLGDRDEDDPGALLYLYSAEEGNTGNDARRPRLQVAWNAPGRTLFDADVVLEPGRVLALPAPPAGALGTLAASFTPVSESGDLTLQWREGAGVWQPLVAPLALAGHGPLELRAVAARNPIALGTVFRTTLRDTWIRSAPPEEQTLRFRFLAPSGAAQERDAVYAGDYTFELELLPEELGRWRYHFEHAFELPYESAEGVFDVLPLEREGVVAALQGLRAEAEAGPILVDRNNVPLLAPRFWRLERALMALETPESFASAQGRDRFALLTSLRELLGGRAVPNTPALKPMKREW